MAEPIAREVVEAVLRDCGRVPYRVLARRHGISTGSVSHICAGRNRRPPEPEPVAMVPVGRCPEGHFVVELPCRSCTAGRLAAGKVAGRRLGLAVDEPLIQAVRQAVFAGHGAARQEAEAAIAVYRDCVWRLQARGLSDSRLAEAEAARGRLVDLAGGRSGAGW